MENMITDEVPDKQPPEGSNIPPLNITGMNTRSATGSGGTSGSTSGLSTAPLSSAGLQPLVSALPVQLDAGRVAHSYSYLPPQTVHLQGVAGNTEQQQIPSSVAPYPSIHGWRTTIHHPVPCYGPVTYPHITLAAASPMDQLYRHPHLQPVPTLQLVHMQPPGQRPSQPATVQDGRGLCFYNHAALAPIPVRQPTPIVQTDRAVPAPSAPTNKVVLLFKKVEPQRNTTVRTAHRQEHSPRVVYHIPEMPADQEECQSNASQLTDPWAVLQKPLETTSSSLGGLSSENVKVLATQPETQEALQPPLLQPEDQETAKGESSLVDFMDDFQLPQDLLNTEQCPDIEKLIASIEPLLPECLFPSLDPKEASQDSSFQEMSLEGAIGDKEVKNIRNETQEKSTLEMQTTKEACVHPMRRTSLLPVTRKFVCEGVAPIIDLCGSEDEESRIHKSNISNRDPNLEEPPSKLPAASFIGKGSFPQRQKTALPPIAFVPRGHNVDGEGNSISGQEVYKIGGTAFGNAAIAGPIYIMQDGGCPTPQTLIAPKDTTTLKCLKKPMKALGSGESHPSPKVTSDLQLPKGKRKTILTEGEPLWKISGKPPGLDMLRPKESTSGSKKVQNTTQRCKQTSADESIKHLSQQRDETLKEISTEHMELPANTIGLLRVQSDSCSEQQIANRSHEEKTKSAPNQEQPVKQKMKIFIPDAVSLDKDKKRNLGGEVSGSLSRELQTGLNNSETMKNTSKEQCKDKAKANVNPSGTKGKKKGAKIEAETVKQKPRSNLALHIMESVQVFYPLGKNNLSALPSKKISTVTSSRTVPANTPTTLPRLPPRPLPKPPLSTWSRQEPTSFSKKPLPTLLMKSSSNSQPKAQSGSLPKPGMISLSKPTLRPGSKPSVSGPSTPQVIQVFQASKWRAQPSVAGNTSVLPRLPDPQMTGLWKPRDIQNQVPPNTPISGFQSSTLPGDFPSHIRRSPSPVQEFNGATFIPWRTPPDDLEISTPITDEQRPTREMMKLQAQKEREEAACWTSMGRVKFFVEREKEMDTSIRFGYTWRL